MKTRKGRYFLYLKDVLLLSVTAFGGPQVFLAMVLDTMVKKRGYITEEELWELNALCQVLPGPTSTQTISAIGFRIGGPFLAYLSLFVWILPATLLMIIAAFLIDFLQENTPGALNFAKFIQPMAIGFIIYAAQKTIFKMIKTTEAMMLMMFSAFISFFYNSPFVFPVLLLVGGIATSLKYHKQPKEEGDKKLVISWSNFYLWGGILVLAAVLGALTKNQSVLLFENFYRNGSLIFGGGQVLVPYLYTEFVEFKKFLSSEEFLTGYAISQGIPGPTFSISSYVGALSMRDFGLGGFLMGGFIAAAGIFLPGTFLIFFVIRFWDQLKKYRPVRAALEGINAVSCGMLIAAAYLLFEPLEANLFNILAIVCTYLLLQFSRLASPLIIVIGILAGIAYNWLATGFFLPAS
ncbi:chromate efflux transporter [Rhodonellum sp.]|uniref:chromate efflux transporter n=1 Tax=Rhodonellum sp. TaxID=2231180 RepID=UPI0027158A3A|nr:chromate efflux transporter [Rhodonellum sp.]MDO9552367.1 chromate efflux transporter [Rhodonellum sp.]